MCFLKAMVRMAMLTLTWIQNHAETGEELSEPPPTSDSVQSLSRSTSTTPPRVTVTRDLDENTVRGLDALEKPHFFHVTKDTAVISLSGLGLRTVSLSILKTSLASGAVREITLAGNSLETLDLSPLAACPGLTRLYLQSNRITALDLTPLAACTKLERLWLQDNRLQVIDLSPLSACKALHSLYLEDNSLHEATVDLTPLSSVTSLRYLRLAGNKLSRNLDLTPLFHCPYLADFRVDCSIVLRADSELSQADEPFAMRHIMRDINFSGIVIPDGHSVKKAPITTIGSSNGYAAPSTSNGEELPPSPIACLDVGDTFACHENSPVQPRL